MELSKTNLIVVKADELGYKTLNGKVYSPRNTEVKFILTDKGYPVISIPIGGKGGKYPIKVHRLVAYQKFGNKIFEKGIQVRHLNGNKLDFSFENIELGTAKQNCQDIPKERRIKASKTAHTYMKRRIPFEMACKIREELKNYQKGDCAKIARKYNISSEIVRGIKRGRYSTPY